MGGAALGQFPGTGFRSDALSALVAARRSGASVSPAARERFLDAVRSDANNYADRAGATSKVMIAAVAGGENPRCFGPPGGRTDFYEVLMSDYNARSGRFGRSAFDHALSLIALGASHIKAPVRAVKFAKAHRGRFGWGFAMVRRGGDDVESTALMIEGLRAVGVSRRDGGLRAAMRWITFQRNSDGGYNPQTSTNAGETQADTTAYAIRAGSSMDSYDRLMKRAQRALRALQESSGAFRSTPGASGGFRGIATADSVLALSGRYLPVVKRRTIPRPCA